MDRLGGPPAAGLIAVFVIGTFLMRSAGCAINDAADFRYDAQVKRTAQRVVAQGLVSPREAVAVATLLAGLSALLLLFLNDAAMRLAVAAVAIAATYPLFKRFFPVPQLYLGVAFSFGIPMAFAAIQGQVPAIGWWLFLANNFWVVAYDTEYAMVDRDDDLRVGIKSSAIFFGRADVAVVMACYGAYLSLLDPSRPLDRRRLALLPGLRPRVRVRPLSLHADPGAHARRVLPGVSPQQLGRLRRVRGHRGGLRAALTTGPT